MGAETVVYLAGGAVVAVLAWALVRLVQAIRDLQGIEEWRRAKDNECGARLTWLRSMDAKLDTACEGIEFVKGQLARMNGGRGNSEGDS